MMDQKKDNKTIYWGDKVFYPRFDSAILFGCWGAGGIIQDWLDYATYDGHSNIKVYLQLS